MITEICMKNVASFKQATLNTDKRINLIYGLNGVVFLTVVIQVHLKILSLFIIKNLYMIIFLFKIV